ncbi:uncharacterized protein BCR38DRAFT_486942 [Pseudomassariella vexata]|uniref:GDS1 winged helix domain-containing protein n=1 Tax=Pseudomassariella vexata TaxID=1141098 RepID=A0A1Y2DU73_9PEZI|nr:uncharacterized protein BCR38DRAFT_486942 [Pseudomassariella vexata]ORY62686.1 hypothetical protein BCR38DRAFT_486942 [Pseudomassariella vexata]
MPYNTRRKSLSLPSLGIHVPSSNPRPTNRVSQNNTNNMHHKTSASRPSTISPASSDNQSHPNKKAKRSHSNDASILAMSIVPSKTSKPCAAPVKYEHTPPPSPGLQFSIEMEDSEPSESAEMQAIDLEGINDDIVEAVIMRLQETRNRPHLVKELTNVLMGQVKIVQQSANPCAIISSRLSTYLKRSCWSAVAPCPLAKELETVHPRRTYFYLTVCPHQPLPDASTAQRAIVTPSLSSSVSTSEDADMDRRRELSLSPEVDLSSPEFDDVEEDMPMPGTPMGSKRQRSLTCSMSRTQRGEEPPLEKDEKEFTQTADGLQKRKLSGGLLSAGPVDNMDMDDSIHHEQLFGETKGINLVPNLLPHVHFMTSPAMRPSLMVPSKRDVEAESWSKLDAMLDWNRSPETVELDELDGLLNDY